MCNLYSVTKGQRAILEAARAMRDSTGNLAPMPGTFPDYPAPIVRTTADGERELLLARWGMPTPPNIGAGGVTNIRNTGRAETSDSAKMMPRIILTFAASRLARRRSRR